MGEFVHLHLHTEYSLLDGAIRIKDLMCKVREFGMDSVAITDHGVMYGVIDFYKQAVKEGIKPILGCEVYTARRTRFDKEPGKDSEQGHLVLLAENNCGYKNLMKIVSCGFIEGFYYRPRIDFEVLNEYSEGLIALSACLSGDIPAAIIQNNYAKARELAFKYLDIFGENNFYLELQINGIEEQNLVNQQLVTLSKETGIPLVATNDVHYLLKEHAKSHDVLVCIQTGKTVDDEDRMKFSSDDFYLKTTEEMQEMFKHFPDSLKNTVHIASRCNVELDFGSLHLPQFKVPDETDSFEYLKTICYEGLSVRMGKTKLNEGARELLRLEEELSIIRQMGYIDYFLIVWDFIRYAKEKGIMVGPGRGSAAGSLVSFCLGITNIDPLKYNLIFERFLNPERISMPDIDIDFCYERRQEVIDYVVAKYGEDKVAQIITFGTMAARASIRDVGRAMGVPYNEVDVIAKMIPFQIGMNIERALELNPQLREIYGTDDNVKELIDTARQLEGMPRHASTHAAGVVISKMPITEYVPLQKNEGNITTQFPMVTLEELGLLKMDFLGLRTLTVIRDTLDLVKSKYQLSIDMDSLDMEDNNVYKLIGEGKTSGIFQLESAGMTQFMKELQPDSLEDIIAGISLYRPGPMDEIPKYIKYKKNPSGIRYVHPLLENILDVTYGCMVYQEQVMQIFRELAGYSMGRSDLVRRAMSKKKASVMEQERHNFLNGAMKNGIDNKTANSIFDQMMDFASYAFNKSHAAAYAVIAYQTGWLKYYYPVEFMASLLNSFLGSSDKVSYYVHDCRLMNIDVLPPDVNESHVGFTVVNKKIRFGLVAVKNVGVNAVHEIIKERQANGKFTDFQDFCQRVGAAQANKRCIESLIKSGAFDSLGIYRAVLMAVYESTIDSILQEKKRNVEGQMNLFDINILQEETDLKENAYPDIEEFPAGRLLSMEKEMLGLYLSGHPLKQYEKAISRDVTLFSKDLKLDLIEMEGHLPLADGMEVKVGGIINGKKVKTTKSDNLMAFIEIEDLYGAIEIIVFPTVLKRYSELLVEENIVLIGGRISIKEEEDPKVICNTVSPLGKKNNIKKRLYVRLSGNEKAEFVSSLKSLMRLFHGNMPVCLYSSSSKKYRLLENEFWVDESSKDLFDELKERLGEDNVVIRSSKNPDSKASSHDLAPIDSGRY